MAKRNRGKTLKRMSLKSGKPYRGTCTLCERTGIKLLYSHRTKTDQLVQVCKNCRDK